MKKLFLTTLIFITFICCNNIFGQAFLKTYTDPTNLNASVSFECITEKTDSVGNLYIGGHIGDTITLFKINTSGTVLSTFKINSSPANTRLDAIMIDNKGSIVVLGNIQTSGANQGFMFQCNSSITAVNWFRQTKAADQIFYWDMTDKTGNYYVVSGERRTNGSALILKINKTSGAPSLAINYKVAGLEDPSAIQLSKSKLYVTGRYALPGTSSSGNGFRFCFSRINTNTSPHYTHLGTYHYTAPLPPLGTARTYSYDILIDGNAAVMVGSGDDNGTADPYKNLNITKVNSTNGVPFWSKKYDDPSAASDGTLTEIRLDNARNYTVMGFAINANTGALDKAKLWSVNPANGNLIWNRQYNLYRRTANNASNYGYGFTIAGSYIYAVGQNSTSGITKGVLLKVNTADGNVSSNDGTHCYDTLKIKKSAYTFYDSIPVDTLISTISSTKPAKQIVKIKMNDSLVCGTDAAPCNCNLSLVYEGNNSVDTVSCGDTVKAVCGTNTLYSPSLQCTDNTTQLIGFHLTDANNNIPSWASNFNGSCPLGIPAGITGIYTLTYIWGSVNGTPCDSCKLYLSVSCCPRIPCGLTATIKTKTGTIQTLHCGDTTLTSCGIVYSIIPTLNCNGDTSTHITYATLLDGNGNTPSWANTFISNNGIGSLSIPAGVSGYYTLTYYWGFGSTICGSCKFVLKVQCCSNFSVNAGPDLTVCCSSSGVQLNAAVSGGTSPYTYSWSPTTGLNNPNIANPVSTTTGTYVVTVTDAFGCIVRDTVKIIYSSVNCCRIAANKTRSQAYPNPFTNGFTLKLPANSIAEVQVTDLHGKILETTSKISGTVQMGKRLAYGAYTIVVNYVDGSKEEIKIIKSPN